MSKIEIPDVVNTLLTPIAGAAPVGVDAKNGDDPVINSLYVDLQMGMKEMTVDYAGCAEKAIALLSSHTKDLWVSSWLTLCWARVEGAEGFRNGLMVILEFLKGYGDAMYPVKGKQKCSALQSLARDKWLQSALTTPAFRGDDGNIIDEVYGLLTSIEKESAILLKESPPDLSPLLSQFSGSPAGTNGSTDSSDAAVSDPVSAAAPVSKTTAAAVNGQDAEQPQPDSQADAPAGENDEVFQYDISHQVEPLLAPVNDSQPAGEDAQKHPDQNVMVLFGNLQAEMSKYSDNDYARCSTWAIDILCDHSKHLRVAVWLLIAWYRIDSFKGLRDGLILLIELIDRFADKLFPNGQKQQSKAIQFLNADRRLRLIPDEKIDKNNALIFVEIVKLFEMLQSKCETAYGDNPPRLKDIAEILNEKLEDASAFLEPAESTSPEPPKPPKPAAVAGPGPGGSAPPARPKSGATATGGSTRPAGKTNGQNYSNDSQARKALSSALSYFFVEKTADAKKFKTPSDPYVYALSRTFRWGKLLKTPEHKDYYTQLNPPEKHKSDFVEKLISENSADLIPYIESNFLSDPGFIYWLDAQKAVVEALQAKGGEFERCAEQIKVQLALLLQRVSELKKLKFSRAQRNMPFASAETQQWIEEEVELILGSTRQEKILPPIMGEDYQPINKEYEKACEALPNDFEQNLQQMQDGIKADDRQKGKFIRMLNMANYCSLARRFPLARAQFNQLMEKIDDYQIANWENALCVAVWRSNYMNNQKLLDTEISNEQRSSIENEQQKMFDKIAKFDSVIALNLLSHESTKGEKT